LFAGPEGLESIRRLAPEIPRLLAPGGLAAVEIGAAQGKAAVKLLKRDGLDARIARDFGERDRAILLTWIK
jgi:release factor glutamine methyltransferase